MTALANKPVVRGPELARQAGAPTKGRDSGSHYGDVHTKNVVAPISHLGDSIGVMAGVALGRLVRRRSRRHW